jgi:hypothetical protein
LATNTGNIAIGKAQVLIGAYVTAGGVQGTMVDVGHTKGPTTLNVTGNDYSVATEQSFGTIRKVPLSASVKLKVLVDEATADNARIAFRQASAQLSGTAPNKTLLVGNITEQYHQIQVITQGTGSTTQATRTFTFYRAIVESIAEVQFAKGQEQTFEITFDILYDDSVATGDKFFKWVDSGGA